jgi:diguanylate cyclase (GGDEF)-like protein
VALAALTIACAFLLAWTDRQSQIRSWGYNLSNLSTTLAGHAEQTLRAADLVLDSVQELIEEAHVLDVSDLKRQLGSRALHEAMRERVARIPQVAVASIVSLDGGIINFTRSYPPPPINMSDRDFYKAAIRATGPGSYLSLPVLNRGNGEWTFYLARPILGAGGKAIGIVIAGIDCGFFNDFYKAMKYGDDSAISLFRTDGVMLAREPMDASMLGRSYGGAPGFKRVLAASADPHPGVIASQPVAGLDTGREVLIAPHQVNGFPVLTTIMLPEDAVLAVWRHTARNVALLSLGLVLAMLCMTFVLARLFDRQDQTLEDLIAARQGAEDAASSKTALLESLHASQEQLTDQSRILKVTLENIDQGLIMVAADGTVQVCNRRAMELLDLPASLMETRPPFRAMVEYQRSIGEFATTRMPNGHVPGSALIMTKSQTYERTRPNGTVLEVHSIPLTDGGMVRTFTDITGRRKSEQQVRFHAHHDGLTGLVNRMVFQETLATAIERADATGAGSRSGDSGEHDLAIHYLDLDGFKQVNDTHGHAVGDRLLAEVAQRLRRAVSEADMVARMGGDEFAIIQSLECRREAVEQLAERIVAVVGEPYVIGDLQCSIGLSIGISLFPDHGATAEDLLRHADIALYDAKVYGKGGFCIFHESMDKRREHAFLMERALNQALPNNEFYLEFQPMVETTTLQPVCFEALVRWRHPVLGVISPGDFIHLAERSGLIIALGQWVLETACREATGWPDDISLAVNVSPVQVSRGNLPEQVFSALRSSGLAAHRLVLEVTEGVLLEDSDTVLDAMSSLRQSGVRFSLDDFGTAHSRLTYLRRFPFDIIKIDRSFVEDAVEQEGARAIVSAMLAIGHAFRLSVVAEGVERSSQLDLLRNMGCSLVQGYLTGPPLGVAAVPKTAHADSKEAQIA